MQRSQASSPECSPRPSVVGRTGQRARGDGQDGDAASTRCVCLKKTSFQYRINDIMYYNNITRYFLGVTCSVWRVLKKPYYVPLSSFLSFWLV